MTYCLYYSPGACSLAPHILLEEIGQPFTLELVSTATGATGQPPYLAINPKGRVPALAIAGEAKVLTELPAISTYLARHHPEAGLLPSDPLHEARCHELLVWLVGWVHGTGFGLFWRPLRFTSDPAQYETLQEKGRQTITQAFREIERQFDDGREWGAGASYSIVDPMLLVLYRWGNRIGLEMRRDHSAWSAIMDRVQSRPAVRRVIEKEGISIDR